MDAGVAAEPALLAAGEAAGAGDGRVQRLLQGRLASQVGEQFLVAEGLGRSAGDRTLGQGAHLVEEAVGELALVAGRDALVEPVP